MFLNFVFKCFCRLLRSRNNVSTFPRENFSWRWNFIALRIWVYFLHFYEYQCPPLVPCVPIVPHYPTGVKLSVQWALFMPKNGLKTLKTDEKLSKKRYDAWNRFYNNVICGQNRQVNHPYEGASCSPDHWYVSSYFGKRQM